MSDNRREQPGAVPGSASQNWREKLMKKVERREKREREQARSDDMRRMVRSATSDGNRR